MTVNEISTCAATERPPDCTEVPCADISTDATGALVGTNEGGSVGDVVGFGDFSMTITGCVMLTVTPVKEAKAAALPFPRLYWKALVATAVCRFPLKVLYASCPLEYPTSSAIKATAKSTCTPVTVEVSSEAEVNRRALTAKRLLLEAEISVRDIISTAELGINGDSGVAVPNDLTTVWTNTVPLKVAEVAPFNIYKAKFD